MYYQFFQQNIILKNIESISEIYQVYQNYQNFYVYSVNMQSGSVFISTKVNITLPKDRLEKHREDFIQAWEESKKQGAQS